MVLIDETYLEARFGVTKRASLQSEAQFSPSQDLSMKAEGHNTEVDVEGSGQLAWKKLLRLLSVRDRSVKECRTKLRESGFSSADSEAAIKKALRCHLLDDVRFADSLVRAKVSAGKGLKGIEDLLIEHDVCPSVLEGFPEGYLEDGVSEFDRACEFMLRHPSRSKNPWKSAYGKLLRAGYDNDSAYRASGWWVAHLEESKHAS